MTVRELKRSFAKNFGSLDFDDTEILLRFVGESGKEDYDCLSYIAMTPDMSAIILGSEQSALKMIKEGKLDINNFQK